MPPDELPTRRHYREKQMGALLGAVKGMWRAVALLLVGVLALGIAGFTATYTHEALGLGFTTTFLVVLGLEAFLAVGALFGIASEVQQRHSEAMDEVAPEQSLE
jgi:hypothetical protein